jgi:hypothetical protein
MRFPSFLLILPIGLSTLHGALAQTQGYVGCYAVDTCDLSPSSPVVLSAHAPNNCVFSPCTAFSGAGVAHTIAFQQPIAYFGTHDEHYGNYTCLMYATTGCTGPSQLVTIPSKIISICRSFSWEPRERAHSSTSVCLLLR